MSKNIWQKEFLYDSRIAQRNMRDGRLDREEYRKFLSSLPDLKDNCDDIGEQIYASKKSGVALTGDYTSTDNGEA